MCPFCVATAAAIAGGSLSAAGVLIFAVKRVFTDADQVPNSSPTEEVQNDDNDNHTD